MHDSGNLALHVAQSPLSPWIVDSGESNHMTSDRSLFTTYSPCNCPQIARIANGTCAKVAGTRIIHLSNIFTLYSILFVPDLNCNLISVSKLNSDLQCETKLFAKYSVLKDLSSGRTIGNAKLRPGLYLLDVNTSSISPFSNNNQVSVQCWSVHSFRSDGQSNKDSAIMIWHFR